MPTYEYACSACGHQWEEVQKISEAALDTCPSCKKRSARRQISGGNFILKGGGWYADLYSSPKKAEKKEANGAKSDTAGDGKKSETKSDGTKSAPPSSSSSTSTSPPAKPPSTGESK